MSNTPAVADLRAITYLEPRPADGTFGVDIVTTTSATRNSSTITETTTTRWHPVDARDGIIWSKERASLLLAVLGYRVVDGWTAMDDPSGFTAFGAVIEPVNG